MRTIFGILVLVLWGCTDSANNVIKLHHEALGDASDITSIIAKAECIGPDGDYKTITKSSTTDDYLLFLQDYQYKPNPFYALIENKKQGFGLDTNFRSQGPLSNAIIAVLKAHEFHEMMMQPELRYFDLKQLEDTIFYGQNCAQLIGSDHLGLPVRLFFDKDTHLMAGIAQANPYKKGEVISVHFDDWNYSNQIPLFNTVNIHQGKKDQYTIKYNKVIFNHPEFEKLELAKN